MTLLIIQQLQAIDDFCANHSCSECPINYNFDNPSQECFYNDITELINKTTRLFKKKEDV